MRINRKSVKLFVRLNQIKFRKESESKMTEDLKWVSLHNHTQYSILESSISIDALVSAAKKMGFSSVGITDSGNLFGAVEFYKACKKEKIKPILGAELFLSPRSRFEKKKEGPYKPCFPVTLIAKSEEGYKNLCKLSSLGYLEGFYYHPRVDFELLEKYKEGLICLSQGQSGRLGREVLYGTKESVEEVLNEFIRIFGENFFLEIERHTMTEENISQGGLLKESWLYNDYNDFIQREKKVNDAYIEMSKLRNIPLVATNDVHYLVREDFKAQEILMNIQSGEPCEIWEKDSLGNLKAKVLNPKRRVFSSHEHYLKSSQEMELLFEDIPEALSNTLKIESLCSVDFNFELKHYPVFIPPSLEKEIYVSEEVRGKAVEDFLWSLCQEGIKKRYTEEKLLKLKEIFPDKDPLSIIEERLKLEMSVIAPKGMCDYLLIVWDFINWAKRKGIPMGPGRGSGAGSIVLYLIEITDIEPLRFHLFFERFINPERISYPDIDVDICMDRRDEVIQYTLQKYGRENIAQIITFGTMKAKMAIKDVGRVLSVPLSKVNMIAKLIPEDLNITLDKALEKDVDLKNWYDSDDEVKEVIDYARKLEGSIRNTGIHAAGIIISGKPLTDVVPVCLAKDSTMPVTQYSMKPVEAVGMLKVDFLGLKTLTAIQICVDAVFLKTGKKIDWVNLSLEDEETFKLLNQGKTLGVFQLESAGMQDLARQLHLDKFEEIIAVGALYRPGPMAMIPSFIQRKHGKEMIENDHPWMQDILAETYGIMVYQEQVMQIASKLAGFSLGEGDVLRRAMGKKDADQMATQREKFRLGAMANGIEENVATHIFDKMERFASYGFNKSHAAAYGYLSYVTAYLKANYPKEWMAALMTCDMDDLTKVAKFIRESHAMGIAILPPDIQEASDHFEATPQGIRFAMTGIKGVGKGVVEAILKEREKGPFKDFFDFFKRVDNKKIGKKVIESMVDAGVFDSFSWSRDELIESVEPFFERAATDQKDKERGVLSLFACLEEENAPLKKPQEIKKKRGSFEILFKEKELLGFFLTGHPMDAYQKTLHQMSSVPLKDIEGMKDGAIFRASFIIESLQIRISAKSQKKFAILTISDGMENFELPIWPEMYEQKQDLIKENQLVLAVLQLEKKEDSVKLSCKWIEDLTKVDQDLILECDRAYDQAKHQKERFASFKKEGSPKPTKEETVVVAKKTSEVKEVNISLNRETLSLQEILDIKELFLMDKGTSPIKVSFQSMGKKEGSLKIDARFGVNPSERFLDKLKQTKSLISVELL